MYTMQSLLVGLLVLVAIASADVAVNQVKNCATSECWITQVYWPSTSVALMTTADGKVWRSADEGFSWSRILNQVDYIATATETNTSVIYFLSSFGTGLNYTVDGGQNIYPGVLPTGRKQIVEFSPHPTMAGWVLATGCSDYLSNNDLCTLYTSQDYGRTWKSSFVKSIEEGSAMWGNSTSEPSLIFVWRSPAGSDPWSYGYTTDWGSSYTVIFSSTYGFRMTQHYQFVAVEGDHSEVQLYASSSRSDPTHKSRSSYKLAEFTFGDELPEDHYQFLDDTTRSEYIAVHQKTPDNTPELPYGTLFTSEFEGQYYQKSLENLFQVGVMYDFHRFRGLGGIYFANTLLDYTPKVYQLTTRITFDNGGSWRYLTPPVKDIDGHYYNCTGECALHLAGPITAAFYSIPEWMTHSHVIGIAIGNGNVGKFLGDGSNPFATFLSRDAGLTWAEIYPNASIYAFGDHGGILVLAPAYQPTTSIYYSYDQGMHFTQLNFTTTPTIVGNIYTQYDGTGMRFFISSADNVGGIWGLDFSNDLTTPCVYPDNYENYSPSNGVPNSGTANCFMGATTVYQRRQQQVACYNTLATADEVVSVTPCPCTFEDYECMWNFNTSNRNATNGFTCGRVYANPPCTPGTQYHEHPNGYALIPDTQCQGGLQLEGSLLTCKAKSHPTEVAALVVVSVLVVAAVVSVVALYFKNNRFRTWVQSLKKGGSGKYREINHVADDDDDNTPFLSGH